MRLERSVLVSLAVVLVLRKCSSFLRALTIFRNWLAESASVQMVRISASELRALPITKLVVFPQPSYMSR